MAGYALCSRGIDSIPRDSASAGDALQNPSSLLEKRGERAQLEVEPGRADATVTIWRAW